MANVNLLEIINHCHKPLDRQGLILHKNGNTVTEIVAAQKVRHPESQFIHYESTSCYKLSRNGGFVYREPIYKTLLAAKGAEHECD
jgi:hypothetical protein